ncbi:MAG: hypothetical protein U9R16_03930 [Campylobacterota bacterium]|nr:hypothetical protein [Campylobacterota bacterium]
MYRLNLVQEDELLCSSDIINNIENYKEFLLQDNKTDFIEEKTRIGRPKKDEK